MPGPSIGSALIAASKAAKAKDGPVAIYVPPPITYPFLNAHERRWRNYDGLPHVWCDFTDAIGTCDLKPGHAEPWHIRGDGLAWLPAA